MNSTLKYIVLALLLIGALLLSAATGALAQGVAMDYIAAPDVYKVVAQDPNAKYVMVEGVWKPGQRDAFHSHPAMFYYWVTPCSVRFYLPDGSARTVNVLAGQAGFQMPVPSHSVENISPAECRVVLFESK